MKNSTLGSAVMCQVISLFLDIYGILNFSPFLHSENPRMCHFAFVTSITLHLVPKSEFLGKMTCIFYILIETAKLISKSVVPIYSPVDSI